MAAIRAALGGSTPTASASRLTRTAPPSGATSANGVGRSTPCGVGFETRPDGSAVGRDLSERGGVGFETRPDGSAVGCDLSERAGATSADGAWGGHAGRPAV